MTKRASTTVRYETSTTIDRPISDVFERLADLDGYRAWMRRTGLFRRSGQTSDGPLGQGTTYLDATRMGTFRGEVTDYEAPARIGFRETLRWFGSELMEARPNYILEADGDKTIVHHVAEGRALRSDAVDEAGGGSVGEKRAGPDRRVVEPFAGGGVADARGCRPRYKSIRRRACGMGPAGALPDAAQRRTRPSGWAAK